MRPKSRCPFGRSSEHQTLCFQSQDLFRGLPDGGRTDLVDMCLVHSRTQVTSSTDSSSDSSTEPIGDGFSGGMGTHGRARIKSECTGNYSPADEHGTPKPLGCGKWSTPLVFLLRFHGIVFAAGYHVRNQVPSDFPIGFRSLFGSTAPGAGPIQPGPSLKT